jgi:3-phenylpropionate/cinnamic acid dioxygenase small subunit
LLGIWEQELKNDTITNEKASAYQRKIYPDSRDNLTIREYIFKLFTWQWLISRVYKQIKNVNTKGKKIHLINGQMNWTAFSKEVKRANKYMKKC